MRLRTSLLDWHFWVVLAYFGLVLVATFGYITYARTLQEQTIHRAETQAALRRQALQERLCDSFLVVKGNQRLILRTLLLWSATFEDRTRLGLRPVPTETLATVGSRLDALDHESICSP